MFPCDDCFNGFLFLTVRLQTLHFPLVFGVPISLVPLAHVCSLCKVMGLQRTTFCAVRTQQGQEVSLNLIFILFYFIFGCAQSSLLCGFSLVTMSRGYSSCDVQASLVAEQRLAARWLSSCGSQALEHRLSNCGELA